MNQPPNVQRFRQSLPSRGENFDSRPSYAASRPVHNGRTYETQGGGYPNRVSQVAQATLSRSTKNRSSPEQKAINQHLCQADRISEIERICEQSMNSFDAVNLGTAWNRLAKLRNTNHEPFSDKLIESLQALTLSLLKDCKSQQIANIAWSLAKLGICNRNLMQAIADEAIKKLDTFIPQGLANIAWAFATLGISDNNLMQAIANEVIKKLNTFIPQGLANIAWAFATLGINDNNLMQAIAEATIRTANNFTPQNLTNTAWAFATLGICNHSLLQAIADEAIRKISTFDPQGLANTAWAFATLGIRDNYLMQTIADATIRTAHLFNAQELANTAWAFAVLGIINGNLMQHIADQSIRKITTFNPQNLANIAWAFATLGISDNNLMQAIANEIIYNKPTFNPQQLSNIAWAFAVCDFEDRKLLGVLADHLHHLPVRGALGENVNQLLQVQDWLRLKGSPFTFAIPSNWPPAPTEAITTSRLHDDVSCYVERYAYQNNLEVKSEHYDTRFHHAIDLVVTDTSSGQKLAIEVDGPYHFNSNGTALGRTLFRNSLISLAGYHFLGIPYLDWNGMRRTERKTWIKARLDEIFQRNPTRGTKRPYPQDAPVREPQRQAVQQA